MSDLPKLFDLHGRVAIITGGAGLLGREFCNTLASAGAAVVVADLNLELAQQAAAEIETEGRQALPVQVDITNPASVRSMVAATLQSFERLDILVNSAAMDPKFDPEALEAQAGASGRFEDYPLEAWNQAINVNLTGAFLCCQAAARPMLASGSGVMINLSSIYGLAAPDQRMYQRPGQPPRYKPVFYTVTKAGILGLTHYLAAYYAGQNIRVNALSPGGVFNNHDEAFVQAYSARAVLGRMAYKDEMNGALLFLASDASKYMTGSNLVMDGGWTVW